jgi:hypothetical protein
MYAFVVCLVDEVGKGLQRCHFDEAASGGSRECILHDEHMREIRYITKFDTYICVFVVWCVYMSYPLSIRH